MNERLSFLQLSNLSAIEDLYQSWLNNPKEVESSWSHFFEGFQLGLSLGNQFAEKEAGQKGDQDALKIYCLIEAYRRFGHRTIRLNPIDTQQPEVVELQLETYGLSAADLDRSVSTFGLLEKSSASLKELLDCLKILYTSAIGVEYMGIEAPEIEKWLEGQLIACFRKNFSAQEREALLKHLNRAEAFETFLHTKYVGQKRFSIEGGETVIPMIAALIERGAALGVTDLLIGMAHRGRLNVLANIMGKSYSYIFREFEDHYTPDLSESTGDVKYHKGFNGSYRISDSQEVRVLLAANPSHLESVDPVLEGETRAVQELGAGKKSVVPLLIHGDAALAGQGVVYETMQFSRLDGYETGGTIHLVINNHIGFTTLPKDGRSTRYCTDIAKAFSAPVFHVNAENPEAAILVAEIAIELRQNFGCDVFIDLGCYRKYGHNEGDEPSFTQPVEYRNIRVRPTIRKLYSEHLLNAGVLDAQRIESLENEFKQELTEALELVKKPETSQEKTALKPKSPPVAITTTVPIQRLKEIGEKISTVPPNFQPHPKIEKLLNERKAMVNADPQKAVADWGMAEMLAYGTLLVEKIHIRLSGQDVQRSTFSHRHAVWIDQTDDRRYFPLSHIEKDQAACSIYNSPLSELAVLGFEFGYSLLYPKSLVLWEAQFGDFFNGAQIVIDQYISSSEQKWGLKTNLVLLLPHGYEGQGPEHSSARIERFLQLSAEDNMIVANCSLPAQLFHLLRKQAQDPNQRPLILFTPKTLLRHPLCVSPLKEFAEGRFQPILDDPSKPAKAKTVVLTSGKFYFELFQERAKQGRTESMALLRVEQLYPFDKKALLALVGEYRDATEFIWAQEEHRNMGAWEFIQLELGKELSLRYVGRGRGAATAAGSFRLHQRQHEKLIEELFSR